MWRSKSLVAHSFHSGKTVHGHDFSQAYGGWKQHVELPYTAHIQKIFCKLLYLFYNQRRLTSSHQNPAPNYCKSLSLGDSPRDTPDPLKIDPIDPMLFSQVNAGRISSRASSLSRSASRAGTPNLSSDKSKRKSHALAQSIELDKEDEEPQPKRKKQSSYELEREENIAKNKVLMQGLAAEFQQVFDDCKKTSTSGKKTAAKTTPHSNTTQPT